LSEICPAAADGQNRKKSASSLTSPHRTRKALQKAVFPELADFALKAAGEELAKRGDAVVAKS
jgi:hypothetical protein